VRSIGVKVRPILALAAVMLVSSCGTGGTATVVTGSAGGSTGDGGPAANTEPYVPPPLGIEVEVPSGWSTRLGPCPDCVSPRGLVDAASYAMPDAGLDFCDTVPPDGVAVAVSEVLAEFPGDDPLTDYPPRPAHFDVSSLRSYQVSEGCDQPRAQLFTFSDAGRYLYAWVVAGVRADDTDLHRAEDVLDGMRFSPLNP
jgi:hypothetical protein